MMKKLSFLFGLFNAFLLICPATGFAQKQGNIWYFGPAYGLDFNSGTPVFISGGMTGYLAGRLYVNHGCSSICDNNGKLLFYTDNVHLWNRNQKVMPHGDSLTGSQSSLQGSIIVPKPGSNNLFYVFTNDDLTPYITAPYGNKPNGYRYSLVDMCLDSSRGDVINGQKNILLVDSASMRLCACRDGQGEGYWVAGYKAISNKVVAWHLTAAGISAPVLSTISKPYEINWHSIEGIMKFSPNGTKLVMTSWDTSRVDFFLYDFNVTTGAVSNECRITIDSPGLPSTRPQGLEFSPDGSKLYVTLSAAVNAQSRPFRPKQLLQYDMAAGSCSAIAASKKVLYSVLTADSTILAGLQAGPDGKLYLCTGTTQHRLGRIRLPNLSGAACQFDSAFMMLSAPGYGLISLPSYVAGFKYHNTMACSQAAIVKPSGSQTTFEIFPNPVKDVVTLRFASGQDLSNSEFDVYNALGQAVMKLELVKPALFINFSEISDGLYIYQLKQNGQILKTGTLSVQK